MDMQEVFDKCYTHLITQNKVSSIGGDMCDYRGQDGTMCAVGCLIKDEHYSYILENESVDDSTAVHGALEASGVDTRQPTINMLARLQQTHDLVSPKDWPKELSVVAEEFNLQVPQVGE
tara:strand:- start:1282 stop:1638 length:357 start_codon:yes stop_codon:yes gene_type:complete